MNTLTRFTRLLLKWGVAAIVVLPTLTTAHVATLYPPATQVHCYAQTDFWSGNPADPGCKLLDQKSGTYPGQQWNEVAKLISNDDGYDYNDQATVEMLIPSGKMCGAADPLKEGLNTPSASWHRTPMQIQNGTMDILVGGTAVHVVSDLYIYMTKSGFNPSTTPMGWRDLELLKKETVTQALNTPPANIPLMFPTQGYYKTTVTVPAGRSGDAVLFMRYQRHDRFGEGFYNCSYITLNDGGGVPVPWHPKGPFILQGFNPKAGDTIRYRVLSSGKSHDEVVDVRLPITDPDTRVWSNALVNALKSHAAIVQVGVLKNDKVVYDAVTPTNNLNYLSDSAASTAMSIIPGGTDPGVDPREPVANFQGPTEAVEGDTVTFDGRSSIGYNGALTFQWATNANDGASPPNNQRTFSFKVRPYIAGNPQLKHIVKLGVYDAKNRKTDQKEIAFVIKKAGDDGGFPQWIPNGGYNSGSQVSNHGVKYRCKQGPAGAWCGQNENEPGKPGSSFWQRAWDVVP